MLDVYLVNESTLIGDNEAFQIAWALNRQAQFHAGRSGWRSDCHVYWVQRGVQPPVLQGHAILHLLDTLDVSDALGYHDEDGNEIPYMRVGVQVTQESGGSVSEVCSHEVMETLVDPHVNDECLTGDGSRLYMKEVGDPVQSTAYDVGEPEGKTLGIQVANFALPAYFDPNTKPGTRVDFRGILSAPFTIAPQGYMSFLDMSNPSAGWQDEFGAERTAPPPPDMDDRRARRLGAQV